MSEQPQEDHHQLAAWMESDARNKPEMSERFVIKDHAIFDTSVNAFVGAGDAYYLLSELQQQLAAELEKAKTLVEALEKAKKHLEATTQALGEFCTSDDVVSMQSTTRWRM